MARVKFDSGDTNPVNTPYTLDAANLYGGNSGTFVNRPGADGTSFKTQIGNPVTDDVNRARQMGADSANRSAYQLNYGDADADHAQATAAGAIQGDSNDVLRSQAQGTDHISSDFQRGLLQKGSDNQTAGALSTSGGALAQMSALSRANAGRAGYMQRGNSAIAGQQANDMAAGRSALAYGEAAQRKGDQTGQYLNDQQSQQQAASEAAQRALNQADQMHNETSAVNVEGQSLQANQHAAANAKIREQATYNKDQADRAREIGYMTTAVGSIPVVGGALGAGATAATAPSGDDPNNPDPTSDERAKTKLSVGALAKLVAESKGMLSSVEAQRQTLKDGPSVGEAQAQPKEDEAPPGGDLDVRPEAPNKQIDSSRADTFSSKPKPLISSMREDGGQSSTLPSDEILDNWRMAHKDPAAIKDQHAPPPGQYDGSMFAKNDGTASADDHGESLAAGIEAAHAKDTAKPAGPTNPLAGRAYGSGPQAAPKGYAASRRGQAGSIERGPEATYDLGFGKGSNYDRGMAPGTGDAVTHGGMDYGLHKDTSWSDYKGTQGNGGQNYNELKLDKSGNPISNFDDYSADVMTSDERAKNKVPKEAVVESPRTLTIDRPASDPAGLEQRDAPAKVGEVMTGDRTMHNPAASRPAASSTAAGNGYAKAEKQETPEERTARFAKKAGVQPKASLWDKVKAGVAGAITSDERAKDKGAGGESESDGTVTAHRTEKQNPLIEMQKGANRALRGEPYQYKEGFGEDTSRVHHGFMAQNLETNPISATAVREDGTGVKKVNNEDIMRVTASGVASLQDQHDQLEEAVRSLVGRRQKRSA